MVRATWAVYDTNSFVDSDEVLDHLGSAVNLNGSQGCNHRFSSSDDDENRDNGEDETLFDFLNHQVVLGEQQERVKSYKSIS